MPPKQVDIGSLDPRQLQTIHEQIENEINNLAHSSVALQKAAAEYGNSGRALEQLSEQQEGMETPWGAVSSVCLLISVWHICADQPMLLPLTSAVYVSGKLASHDAILLDIGTGYYAEVRCLTVRSCRNACDIGSAAQAMSIKLQGSMLLAEIAN